MTTNQQLKAHCEDVIANPALYCIVDPDGVPYMSELCVATEPSVLEDEVAAMNDDLEDGESKYTVQPLFFVNKPLSELKLNKEQRKELIDFIEGRLRGDAFCMSISKMAELNRMRDEVALAALTQPASPALKLPDEKSLNAAVDAVSKLTHESRVGSYQDGWNACIAEVKRLNAPHTAPIDPICATGGAEWVSNERVEEIIYRAEMFGHGAGYLPNEVIPMAKELLALRKAFSEPVAFQNNYTGKLWRPEQQPGAEQDADVYSPLFRKP